jgi:Ser/Thr protein kinase RdoA (MazF antagonist)
MGMKEVLTAYGWDDAVAYSEIEGGHIHATYKIELPDGTNAIIQTINTAIFSSPEKIIHNQLQYATLCKQQQKELIQVPSLIPTLSGEHLFTDSNGNVWRASQWIENGITIERSNDPSIAFETGSIIAWLHRLNVDETAHFEVILPDFHFLPLRLNQLGEAKKARTSYSSIESELLSKIDFYSEKVLLIWETPLPKHLTHNDTKLNNILFDSKHRKAIALIDLDTLMVDTLLFDFGDALRSLASSSKEDSTALDAVYFDLNVFYAFTKGYASNMKDQLTLAEKKVLFEAILLMPLMIGARFLTDYFNGNTYYKVDYPEHNLHRAQNQLALCDSIYAQQTAIKNILADQLG